MSHFVETRTIHAYESRNLGRLTSAVGLWGIAALLSAASAFSEVPAILQGLQVSAEGSVLTVSGLAANGHAIVASASREPLLGAVQVDVWAEEIYDDDGDGKAALDLGEKISLRSIWASVEVSSGAAGSTAPAGSDYSTSEAGPEIVEVDEVSGHRIVKLERTNLIFVLVRPGVGAWSQEAWDGGAGDLDMSEPNGWLHVDPATFSPIGESPAPFSGLAAGDVVLIIDPDLLDLQIYVDASASLEAR